MPFPGEQEYEILRYIEDLLEIHDDGSILSVNAKSYIAEKMVDALLCAKKKMVEK